MDSTLDPGSALPRMLANMAAMFAALARSSDGGRTVELDGVRASVVPACPQRSVVNSVIYSDAAELERCLPRLAEEYERAGVLAWTVWVPEADRRGADILEAAGHNFDAQPSAMVLTLDGFEAPPAHVELSLIEPDMAACARVNDVAYGFPGAFERAFNALPGGSARLYLANADGVPASTVITYEDGGECGVATACGRPVYERLGVRDPRFEVLINTPRAFNLGAVQREALAGPRYSWPEGLAMSVSRVLRRVLLLVLALLSLAVSVAPRAIAATSVSGQVDTTSPLVIDPTVNPADAMTNEVPQGNVAWIESMPVTKTINRVVVGDIGQAPDCTAPTQIQLLIGESKTGANGDWFQTITPSGSSWVSAPSSPARVSFQFGSPVTLKAGYAYKFWVSTFDSCGKVVRTTWGHNSAVVNGGPAKCYVGPETTPQTYGGMSRMWHSLGANDSTGPCVGSTGASNFDFSMPQGWLITDGAVVVTGQTTGPNPPDVASSCHVTPAMGATLVFWRTETYSWGNLNRYVCQWTPFRAFGDVVADGWYYSYPWRTDASSLIRDTYLKLDTAPSGRSSSEQFGASNPAEPNTPNCQAGKPVDCATGNYWESYTDFHVGGLGVGLDLDRTYNAQAAASASWPGRFGYGWSSSFSDHLTIDQSSGNVTVHQDNGSTVPFSPNDSGGYAAPGWVQATLTKHADGSCTYVLPDHSRTFAFDSSGKLQSEADANGNTTNLTYDASGNLTTITDPAGRTITLAYNADGTVDHATDPAGHTVHYGYDASGNLTDVTDVGGGVTHFGYDASHRLTTVTDPRGHTVTTNVYDASNRVTSQTDALNRTITWDYGTPGHTKITDPAGQVTDEQFDNGLPVSITKAAGTSSAATWTYGYDANGNLVSKTDPNNHQWSYSYDAAGNRLSATDPLNRTTSWTYDSDRNVKSITSPSGRVSSFDYDGHDNLTKVTRTLTETGQQAITSLEYNALGELTKLTDPLSRSWTYGYDSQGDRTSVTSPLGHKATASFDQDSFETSSVSARGNEPGANPADYTTTYTRDAFGRPTDIEDPQAHHELFSYDPDGNLTDATDRDGRHTQFTYDAENQQTQVTRGDGSILKTSYNPDGQVSKQTDGLNQDTSYGYDDQDRLTSVTDPLNRQTSFGYDAAGNRTSLTDALGHATTYGYDAVDELTSIHYSTGNPQDITLSYNQDGQRSSMVDGSGTTTYSYDSLGRLTGQTNGASQHVGYGYDLADQITSISYPDALTALDLTDPQSQQQHVQEGTVTRTYDDDGNLASVTDWLNHQTTFNYDADGNLASEQRPNGTTATYAFDRNDGMTSIDDVTGHTDYGRTPEELLSSVTPPGEPLQSLGYDGAQRLTSAGSAAYTYDAADNLTQTTDPAGQAVSQSFDNANEIASQSVAGATTNTFGYDANGNRTSATDAQNNPTTYTYDQANQLIDYEGPDHTQPGQTVSDQFVYDGDGLRQTKTQNNQLTNEVWDSSGSLPLLIEDGPTAYITGPDSLPLEEVTQDGTVRYYSHDQLGSTTALTNQAGDTVASYQFDDYGNPAGSTPAVQQPFGYAGQYTDTETGLQYLRARYYDPSSGQMLTRDPAVADTGQPYAYASDNPANATDPTGLESFWNKVGDYLYGAGVREVAVFDGLTGGLTTDVRHALGIDDSAVLCSPEYQSRYNAGLILSFALPVGGDLRAAEEAGHQAALRDLVNEVTHGGRKPLSVEDANTVLQWAQEHKYPGVRARPGDLTAPSNWRANPVPHIHLPGAGRGGHVPVEPGVDPLP